MAYYYTVATKKVEDNNSMKVFESEHIDRMRAKEDIRQQCASSGYVMGEFRPYKNMMRQDGVLTKNIQRKRKNGELKNDAFFTILHWKDED